ncbi:MAG: hypothetical protein UW46_C0001G0013 [Candidatus Yanofskybacteria bacterium GW2011_GWF1_44_227]|uniref:PD-(D/E)XK endonuclease-like domain-containing protein n=1 Tax=Candidatus Yanofskybacteria bacterium GW2011_GWE2_40_11 TaxID=1619033 RepID=A0A0G0TSD3_9BACT|nr:MAG: hypothetical protein UT69_C0011G0001 [Candidatus Yanofskybacteria bacterium GW2011_GWE1_40_10]KKR40767.1 MAG: hypothetical protein UT75_C0005G0075 [Candidatus Yanofskybacteria bacterium GW2011_GWE2_40_11]KKT15963.1 MAG: hypothetical protein UV97_C0001G0136 [Candidatus Yanofskybacteria bacterium GW2011_GWF2_43_596]KKT53523.1 MAG: hypothetical protein UW46_C0001G0013 [Candidatus Yanofskybacteria bacterium GW2011_GWF1_44_227]OGN37983.1 MAG: hypothetical protein A2405_00625 [Candidatus Yano
MSPIQNYLKISRSGLKLFLECPRCFWLDNKHKIKRPPSFPYTLSSAVDFLVKKEFDQYRAQGVLPPAFAKLGLDAKLFSDPKLSTWRENFVGIQYFDESLNAMLYGAVDDILEFSDGSLAVIDYKSTGSREPHIYDDYQKQMDTYTHLLDMNGYKTIGKAYFHFFIVDKTPDRFDYKLNFNEEIKDITVDPTWVADVFERAVKTARQTKSPVSAIDCKHCNYVDAAIEHGGHVIHAVEQDKDFVLIPEE